MPRQFSDKFEHAIELTERQILEIDSAVKEALAEAPWSERDGPRPMPPFYWKVEFADSTTDTNLTTEAVLKLANSKAKEIVSLETDARTWLPITQVKLTADSRPHWRVFVIGEGAAIDKLRYALVDIAMETRPWWWRIEAIALAAYPLIALVLFILFRTFYAAAHGLFGKPSTSQDAYAALVSFVAIAVPITMSVLISLVERQVKPLVFPPFTFLVGGGVKRAENAKGVRRVFLAALLPIVFGLWAWANTPTPFGTPAQWGMESKSQEKNPPTNP